MQQRDKFGVYLLFFIIYFIFTIYTLMQKSIWAFDGFLWLALLIFLFLMRSKLNLTSANLIFINLALLMHMAGYFGAYSIRLFNILYDKWLHVFATMVVAFIAFKFIKYDVDKKDFKKHILFFVFAAVAIAVALSLIIELMEFGGYYLVGQQNSILSPGAEQIYGNYDDTMGDIIANILGSIVGAFAYFLKHKK